MSSKLVLWQPENSELPANVKRSSEIVSFAAQLSGKDKKQIITAFENNHFEMGINFLWGKTEHALKKELASVGITFLAEMLGRTDVDENDDVADILTTKDAIRLASELGVISSTDAVRLRHTHELLTHFSRLDTAESDNESIDESEAISSLKACIKGVLGRPKVEVAKKFVEFRNALEEGTLSENDPQVEMLKSSPYFFSKLTVSVLMSATKKNLGAKLEHVLANVNVLIPSIWDNLRDPERWQVGHTYAEMYSEGKKNAFSGLKSALIKVNGFDYVPENLRSDTFIKAAEDIVKAHEGMNNFYNEPTAVRHLAKLGTTIPTPAFPACATALLCVILGNSYGVAWNAVPDAKKVIKNFSEDRWQYYFNQVFPSDIRVLQKLMQVKPTANWIELFKELKLSNLQIKNSKVASLIKSSKAADSDRIEKDTKKLLAEFYGTQK